MVSRVRHEIPKVRRDFEMWLVDVEACQGELMEWKKEPDATDNNATDNEQQQHNDFRLGGRGGQGICLLHAEQDPNPKRQRGCSSGSLADASG